VKYIEYLHNGLHCFLIAFLCMTKMSLHILTNHSFNCGEKSSYKYAFIHHKVLVTPWLECPPHAVLIDKTLISDKILIRKQSNNRINAGLPSAKATFARHILVFRCNI